MKQVQRPREVCVLTSTWVHACACEGMHEWTHIRTHTDTHTHTQAQTQSPPSDSSASQTLAVETHLLTIVFTTWCNLRTTSTCMPLNPLPFPHHLPLLLSLHGCNWPWFSLPTESKGWERAESQSKMPMHSLNSSLEKQ